MFGLRKRPVQSGEQEASVDASRWIVALALGAAACNPSGTINITTTSATASDTSPTKETHGASSTSGPSETGTTSLGTTSTSTGPSTTAESSVTGEATTEDCTFDNCDDMGGSGIECDVFSPGQSGCPEGEKCVPSDAFNHFPDTKCIPITGEGKADDECEIIGDPFDFSNDACAEGYLCSHVDQQTNKGICLAQCVGEQWEGVCDEGEICEQGINLNYAICENLCDPLEPECPPEEQCIYGEEDFLCTDIFPDVSTGSSCENGKCSEGDYCVSKEYYPSEMCEENEGCCAPLCDLENPTCPDDIEGLECVDLNDDPDDGNLGVCAVF